MVDVAAESFFGAVTGADALEKNAHFAAGLAAGTGLEAETENVGADAIKAGRLLSTAGAGFEDGGIT